MHNSKVIQYLQRLSAVELGRFEKFLMSPYFNSHDDTIRLFLDLKPYYPDFEDPEIEMEKVFNRLYPNESYETSRMYTLRKYLLKLLSQFLIIEAQQTKHPDQNRLILLEELFSRKLEKFVPNLWKESEMILRDHPFRNANFYLLELKFREFETHFALIQSHRSHTASYEPSMESLDHFYMIQKLRYACLVANRKQAVSLEKDILFLEEIITYCQSREFTDVPAISLYYHALMISVDLEQEQYFETLEQQLLTYPNILPKDELANIYTLMVNYCTRLYRKGALRYLKKMFTLYQSMLNHQLVFEENDAMTVNFYFKNIVTLGLTLKEYAWTESFIRKYRHKLVPEYRPAIFNYSLANLHFSKGEYGQSLKYLQKVQFIDPFLRLNYYMLLMKTYYECRETESLQSLLNTFSVYIRRNKSLSANNHTAYLNMAKFLRKISRVREGNRRKKIPQLKESMETVDFLVERKWLQEKLDELDN